MNEIIGLIKKELGKWIDTCSVQEIEVDQEIPIEGGVATVRVKAFVDGAERHVAFIIDQFEIIHNDLYRSLTIAGAVSELKKL